MKFEDFKETAQVLETLAIVGGKDKKKKKDPKETSNSQPETNVERSIW